MKTILTGDRPSGALHLGHLLGSLENRIKLQTDYETFILIADIQAHTDNYLNPEKTKEFVIEIMKDYLACGLDPKLACITLQSSLPPLIELTQILSHFTNLNHLKQNPTLKKEIEQKKINNLSFFSYPVSQAADILAFGADLVPVGEDQNPILEMTNTLARTINKHFKQNLLKPCQGLLSPVSRLKGTDGVNKMSKSLNNCIYLKDSSDEIKKKVYKMFTDPLHIRVEQPGHLENNTVVYFLDILDPEQKELGDLKNQYQLGGVADITLKNRLVEIMEAKIQPIRTKRMELNDNQYLLNLLRTGQGKAMNKITPRIQALKDLYYLSL